MESTCYDWVDKDPYFTTGTGYRPYVYRGRTMQFFSLRKLRRQGRLTPKSIRAQDGLSPHSLREVGDLSVEDFRHYDSAFRKLWHLTGEEYDLEFRQLLR